MELTCGRYLPPDVVIAYGVVWMVDRNGVLGGFIVGYVSVFAFLRHRTARPAARVRCTRTRSRLLDAAPLHRSSKNMAATSAWHRHRGKSVSKR